MYLGWIIEPEVNACFYSQAAELVIKESVEPLLEEYRPPGITSLKFSKLSLGTVAPKIEGIPYRWSMLLNSSSLLFVRQSLVDNL